MKNNPHWDIQFPQSLTDFTKSDDSGDGDCSDESESTSDFLARSLFGSSQPARNSYAAKPGLADTRAAFEKAHKDGDLAGMVAAIVAAKVQTSPSTFQHPPVRESKPAPATQAPSAWSWTDEVATKSDLPKDEKDKKTLRRPPMQYADSGSDLTKRAADGTATESDYVAMLLGDAHERRAARAAVAKTEEVKRGDCIWKVSYDAKGVVISEFLISDSEENE